MITKEEFKEIEEHFVGFWKYQAYSIKKGLVAKSPSYCVTICINGNHIDTRIHKNPINAFKEASKIIKLENKK